MIGVTAAASAASISIGGSSTPPSADLLALGRHGWLVAGHQGPRPRAKTRALRIIFAVVVAAMGVQLLVRALTGKI